MTHNLNFRIDVADENAQEPEPTGTGRAACSCGLDTGTVAVEKADAAWAEHCRDVELNLPT